MTEFSERVIRIIAAIPPGEIMTYGEVSRAAGSARGARQVSRLLHSCTGKYDLPWHRVVGKGPRISLPGEGGLIQRKLLEEEGVFL
ncbi:MAG: MGMT family protein [Spirochaetales bacterium]|nr:MGMT family protein [Spirochaetales bacterium]